MTNAWIDWFHIIHHTWENKQHCHAGNTARQWRLGLFQDSDFEGDLEDSKKSSLEEGTLCIFGSDTFGPISWMCKKQTAVLHSSTESEIICLDTGLRLDGLPALELCGIYFPFLEACLSFQMRTGRHVNVDVRRNQKKEWINVMENIDSFPSSVQSSFPEALL